MTYYFTDVEPVKGECIASWSCDAQGEEVYEDDFLQDRPLRPHDNSQREFNLSGIARLPHRIKASTNSSTVRDIILDIPESKMIAKLSQLMEETQEVFGDVLNRNAQLEAEVKYLREALNARISSEPSPVSMEPLLPSDQIRLPVSDEWCQSSTPNLSVFDISTPPTYKENLVPARPVARHPKSPHIGRPVPLNPSSRRGISIFHS
jgi:hypothetical protein